VATGRLVDGQVLLHRRRGAADLPAGLLVAARGEQRVQRSLDRVRLARIPRSQIVGESAEWAPLAPMAREHRGSPLHTRSLDRRHETAP
jgi:hypothetical protein